MQRKIIIANKIEPTSETLPAPASSALLNLLKGYVQSKACYHPAVLENAKVTKMDQGCGAYQIDLWTLVEHRELKEVHRPYGGEFTSDQPPGNKWEYVFQQPSTIVGQAHTEVRDLEQTRRRIVCSQCNGAGRCVCHSCKGEVGRPCHYCRNKVVTQTNQQPRQPCSHCFDSGIICCSTCNSTGVANCPRCRACGQLLQWYQLAIEWSTLHSVSYQSNTSVPRKIIRDAPGKQTYWAIDQKWSIADSFDTYFRNAFANQNTPYPVKLDELNDDFNKNHLEKINNNARIVQVKWDIKKLDIFDIEYELEGYVNKRAPHMNNRFRFYYYGTGKNNQPLIYENDYPLNSCGCCGAGCAHYSKCCTIS